MFRRLHAQTPLSLVCVGSTISSVASLIVAVGAVRLWHGGSGNRCDRFHRPLGLRSARSFSRWIRRLLIAGGLVRKSGKRVSQRANTSSISARNRAPAPPPSALRIPRISTPCHSHCRERNSAKLDTLPRDTAGRFHADA